MVAMEIMLMVGVMIVKARVGCGGDDVCGGDICGGGGCGGGDGGSGGGGGSAGDGVGNIDGSLAFN